MADKQRSLWGVLFCGSAVILGAFGAHLLEQYLSPEALQSYEVGVRYQFFHGLALLFLSLKQDNAKFLNRVAILFIIGTVLFSGSIFGLALGSQSTSIILPKILGPITPMGGSLLIVGWIILFIGFVKS
ncbi:MAG: DUF423 domain-containing protein [Flavobacteriaceae bacterium]|nr:DUF423 domain-containing protein [Flavobacteriaceae bacterium]